jgi:hypothetical protein
MKRSPQAGLSPRVCPTCGERYQPYRTAQRACSRKCTAALGPIPEHERPYTLDYTCQICAGQFTARTTVKGGRRYFCDGCAESAARARADRKNANRSVARGSDPDARRRKNRESNLRKNYGLTIDQYDEMLERQNGVCLLCADSPKGEGHGASSRLHVDHDHETGRVRALLCNNCNRAIGHFRDDPDLMQRASLYVWQHRQLEGND